MLPCKKRATSSHAARYLSRATKLARAIKSAHGVNREIIDGCIVEGRRAGRLLTATSIEPPGSLVGVISNSNYRAEEPSADKFIPTMRVPVVDSAVFRPEPHGLDAGRLGDATIPSKYTKVISIGALPVKVAPVIRQIDFRDPSEDPDRFTMIVPHGNSKGENHVVSIYNGDGAGHGHLSIRFENGKEIYRLLIASWVIKGECDGYGISHPEDMLYWASRASIVETGRGKAIAVFTAGKKINTYRGVDYYQDRLVRLDIDLKLAENESERARRGSAYDKEEHWINPDLQFAVFPDALIPPSLAATSILADAEGGDGYVSIPAISTMSVADLALDDEGGMLAAIRWEAKQQNGDSPNNKYSAQIYHGSACTGVGVSAFGLASWGGDSEFFNIHTKEVFSSNDAGLIAKHGVDAGVMLHGDRAVIFNGDVYRWVMRVERSMYEARTHVAEQPVPFASPPAAELVNGVSRQHDTFGDILYSSGGLHFRPGAAIYPGSNDFYTSSDWTREAVRDAKCMVGGSTLAMAAGGNLEMVNAGFIRSASQGIGFMDGERRRYEPLSEDAGTPQYRVITVTCHQKEVRDKDGKLETPSVLVVSCFRDGKQRILVRKGPIWEEDMDEPYKFDDYWTVLDAPNTSHNFYHYVGSPLHTGDLDSMFAQKGHRS